MLSFHRESTRLVMIFWWCTALCIGPLGLVSWLGSSSLVLGAMEVLYCSIVNQFRVLNLMLFDVHEGFLNRLLSWKGFLPLSRLTYCVYLIHWDFLNVYYSAVRKRYYYRLYEQFVILFGIFLVMFALAFAISASIEVSFLRLEKLIFSSKPKRNSLPERND
jgi:peptidoglycan/LPS O-acetylase OafA/YrhL